MTGRHSEEAAENRGEWLRWHDGADVGSTPGFRHGGKSRPIEPPAPRLPMRFGALDADL
jgi:hypothetical protein